MWKIKCWSQIGTKTLADMKEEFPTIDELIYEGRLALPFVEQERWSFIRALEKGRHFIVSPPWIKVVK